MNNELGIRKADSGKMSQLIGGDESESPYGLHMHRQPGVIQHHEDDFMEADWMGAGYQQPQPQPQPEGLGVNYP